MHSESNNNTQDLRDIIDDLSSEQLADLNQAIHEADTNNTISWTDFKKEMKKWKEIPGKSTITP